MNSAKTYLVGIVLGMALMAATRGYAQSEEQKALEARKEQFSPVETSSAINAGPNRWRRSHTAP